MLPKISLNHGNLALTRSLVIASCNFPYIAMRCLQGGLVDSVVVGGEEGSNTEETYFTSASSNYGVVYIFLRYTAIQINIFINSFRNL